MKRLFEDENYRTELSVRAKKYVESFSMQHIGEQWMELFREMEN